MVFGAIMPSFVGLANWLIPMMIGAPDMALPRMNNWSFWILPPAFLMLASTLFMEGGAPAFGWTFYAPLSTTYAPPSVTFFIFAHPYLGRVIDHGLDQYHCHGDEHACAGHDIHENAHVRLDLVDHCLSAGCGDASVGGCRDHDADGYPFRHQLLSQPLAAVIRCCFSTSSGFLAIQRCTSLFFPAFGVVSQIIPAFSRKPLFGYASMVYATASIAFLSFVVWAHHMYTVGMPVAGELFFMYATMLIAVPTGVKVFNWISTMWRGSLSFETPMLVLNRLFGVVHLGRVYRPDALDCAGRFPVPRHLFCRGPLPLRDGGRCSVFDDGGGLLLVAEMVWAHVQRING